MRPTLVATLVILSAAATTAPVEPRERKSPTPAASAMSAAQPLSGYTPRMSGTPASSTVPCFPGLSGGNSSLKTYGYVDAGTGLAVEGEVWTFDHMGTDPWEGWTRHDLTTNEFTAFRHLNSTLWTGGGNISPPPIITGTGSLWLGFTKDEADSACWAAGAGYGNNWRQVVISPPFENSVGSFSIEFDYWYDCENGFDEVKVLLVGGGGTTELLSLTGQGGSYNAPLQYSQNFFGTGVYTLRFRFTSDGSYSDEDDLYSTPYGPFGVDNVNMADIEDVGGQGPPYEFDTGLDGWTPTVIPGVGIYADLNDWPSYGLSSCGQNANVVTFHNGSLEHPALQHERIVSPTVDISSFGATDLNVWAEYDLYTQNPLTDQVFWRWGFQYWPEVCPVTGDSTWSDYNGTLYFYSTQPVCQRVRSHANDTTTAGLYSSGTTLVPAGADSIRLFFEVRSQSEVDGGNESPMFDNIVVGVSDAASVLHVPSPAYPDIWSALSAIDPGDSIIVRAGTYTGPNNVDLDFDGVAASIVSEEGAGYTIIDCQELGRGFRFGNAESPATLVQGFTIKNGDTGLVGNAIYVFNNASPTIRDIIVTDNLVTGSAYGAVRIDSGNPLFECFVAEYDTATASGGLVIVNGGVPEFDTCVIQHNQSQFSCVSLVGGSPKLTNVAVFENVTANAVMVDTDAALEGCHILYNSDVGMYFFPASPSTVDSCFIQGNGGGGIVLEDNSSTFIQCMIQLNEGAGVEMTNVSFAGAAAPGGGGSDEQPASSSSSTTTTFIDCVISGNVNTSASGGGIRFDCSNLPTAPFTPLYLDCIITGNASLFDGGGIAVCGVSVFTDIAPVFENCTISSNTAGGVGGGIYCDVQDESEVYSGIVTMERSIMWGNCASGGGNQAYTEAENVVMFDCSDIDSTGVEGFGSIIYGGEQAYEDPSFCSPASCNPSGTIEGQFTVAMNSPVIPENSPCGQLIGAGDPVCSPPTDAGDTPGVPAETALRPNVPNPFNPTTTIRFDLARPGQVTLIIYNVRGRRVRTLVDGYLPASTHARLWDGTNDHGEQISTGVYFARLSAGDVVETRKLVLVK